LDVDQWVGVHEKEGFSELEVYVETSTFYSEDNEDEHMMMEKRLLRYRMMMKKRMRTYFF